MKPFTSVGQTAAYSDRFLGVEVKSGVLLDEELLERMRKYVVCGHEKNCWPWSRARTKAGYGELSKCGHMLYAHRTAYVISNGVICTGLSICHHCDNPPCCNPFHLFAALPKDNSADAVAKGRIIAPPLMYGEAHPMSKLKRVDVERMRETRRTTGISYRAIAELNGVNESTARRAIIGDRWK